MTSRCHAAVSLNCSILAAPWFTSVIWHLLFPSSDFLPLLLPTSISSLSHNMSSPALHLRPHGASGSPGHQAISVPTEFTGKLTFLVLKSWTLSADFPDTRGCLIDLLLPKLAFCICSFWSGGTDIIPGPETQSGSCLNLSSLILYIQAGCHHQPWRFSLQTVVH